MINSHYKDGDTVNIQTAIDKGLAILSEDRPQTLDEWWEQLTVISNEQSKPKDAHDIYLTRGIEPEIASKGGIIKVSSEGVNYKVTIPKNTWDGLQLKLKGKGRKGKNGRKDGDLLLTLYVLEDVINPEPKPKPINGDDIHLEKEIVNELARKGGVITVSVNGVEYQLRIPENLKGGSRIRYKEIGQEGKNGGKNGNLILTLIVLDDGIDREPNLIKGQS